MQKSGFVIRFVDVGLILLFCFLAVSEVRMSTRLSFGTPVDRDALSEVSNDIVRIGIMMGNASYTVIDWETSDALHEDIQSQEELSFILQTLQKRYLDSDRFLAVIIDVEESARMQDLMDVLDVCERLNIPRQLDTRLLTDGEEA